MTHSFGVIKVILVMTFGGHLISSIDMITIIAHASSVMLCVYVFAVGHLLSTSSSLRLLYYVLHHFFFFCLLFAIEVIDGNIHRILVNTLLNLLRLLNEGGEFGVKMLYYDLGLLIIEEAIL